MTIGEEIRRIRLQKGLKQKDLAALAGVPTITLQQYERGVTKQPKLEQLQKIAAALEIPISFFIDTDIEDRVRQEHIERIETELGGFTLQEGVDPAKIAERAEELRQQNHLHRPILDHDEINQRIAEAEQELKAYVESLCFDPEMPAEDYPARIRYITSFVEKNADMLKLAMPGSRMLPDDIKAAERIRTSGKSGDKK
ncbi:MAG TPA: helix-turn-helix transcriptional regulator [Candidatus Intestinimonas merdavium]|uniref:Helix-turn-helix transcriptional regulator n=1 Tax=Candidatus Intestinimonas merdavium TaxID=2838622 RepID=A0A9D1Z6I1_9FIRM|nr:helix-turn-helix transcriptional regulator [Candidatus Intestinimonas merdavium]